MIPVDIYSAIGLLDQIYDVPLDPDPWRIECIREQINDVFLELLNSESIELTPQRGANYYYMQITIRGRHPNPWASTEYVFTDPIFDMFYYFLMTDE